MAASRESPEPLALAWELAVHDVPAARAEAQKALEGVDAGSEAAAWAFWLLALADVHTGAIQSARARLQPARLLFVQHDSGRGQALCDELEALFALHAGDGERAREIHEAIDAAEDPGYLPFDRFLAHSARATTARLLGEHEWALTHFHDALEAAEECGNAGAHAVALANLGGMHLELFDLEDARIYSEKALNAARATGARSIVTSAAANLIVIHHAAGRTAQAIEAAEFLTENPQLQLPGALASAALPIALAHFAKDDIDRAEAWLEGGSTSATPGDATAFWAWLSARCLMRRGEHALARDLAERTLKACSSRELPYHQMKLMQAASETCEVLGDLGAALRNARQAQTLYEQLVDHGLRARNRALQAAHDYARVERELATAQRCRAEAESDRRRLSDLNRALEAKVSENELLQARLREQVLRDPLTGLHNRRYLFEIAPGLVELARQQRQPLSVVLIDLDHFKMLNDGHGHAAGDLVLQKLATMLTSHLRRQDIACRYGGEEFVVVMPDLDGEQASTIVERVLEALGRERVESRGRVLPRASFSAGVACFPAHGDRLEQLLGRADKALYRAKEAGRSRVEFAQLTGFAVLG
jgi:diguanylate cyclase (GGDEF)-like protein